MTITTKPATVHINYQSGREMQFGEESTRRYKDLECAMDDCIFRSPTGKVIVTTKKFDNKAEDPYDYYITICD